MYFIIIQFTSSRPAYLLNYYPRFTSISEIAFHLQASRIIAMRATFLAHTILLGLITLLVHFCWIGSTL